MDWISVDKMLPDAETKVLLYTPENIFGEDHACIGNRDAILSCKPLFTHWLPLPGAPADDESF